MRVLKFTIDPTRETSREIIEQYREGIYYDFRCDIPQLFTASYAVQVSFERCSTVVLRGWNRASQTSRIMMARRLRRERNSDSPIKVVLIIEYNEAREPTWLDKTAVPQERHDDQDTED